ncbi:MAG: two-component sensor histidine kinase [Hydrogenophaga sp.]|uniref:sensor histidine kinase n=1 Tax=Hydrogenophaga sp. TaxID=1904254 RepID=UPI00257C6408|nr:ATP-binding protein [Hydrogenophaga sp.]MBL0944959.1 two-component sensor histidine kinase [Hydrogenophaga sp.]
MNPPAAQDYQEELADFRVTYSRAGCITSIVLVLGGVGLDLSSYPAYWREFLAARVGVALATAFIFGLLFTGFGRRHVRVLTMVWLLLPQAMIAGMIQQTDGVESIYFVGLHLALYAVGIILPISFFESVSFGLVTLGLYLLACVFNANDVMHAGMLTTNALFILFSAAAAAVCTWFNERARLRLFSLQREVRAKNASLVEINQTLTEVKGQLVHREKMAAIGTLSAGLLHELNNPVNFSLMAIDMGRQLPAAQQDPMLAESLADAREGLVRIQNIVTDLKTFAYQKPGGDSLRPFLFENAVRSAVRLAGFDLKDVAVRLDLPQDTHVLGDEPALIGVMINLLSNAAHAVRVAQRDKPEVVVKAVIEGDRMHVTVRDNGQGILPENLERVFEPFFTTRDVGSGLGLGLSISYGIVQRHGGTLSVRSEHGAWTEFHFDLGRPV